MTASSGYSILVKIGSSSRKKRQATAPKTAAMAAIRVMRCMIFFLLSGLFLISSCMNPILESLSVVSCIISSRSGCSLLIGLSFPFF